MTKTEHVLKIGLLAYRLSRYVKLHCHPSRKIGRVKRPMVMLSIYMLHVLWVVSHVVSSQKASDGRSFIGWMAPTAIQLKMLSLRDWYTVFVP
jgi:hypothetical protein